MRQTFHILKKDLYHLRLEVVLLWILALIRARTGRLWWTEVLLLVAAAYVTARVVHNEPIPGDNQFWITRPYRRDSLAFSKMLFVLVAFHVPVFLAQMYILATTGFSLVGNLAGILWAHILLFFLLLMPVATVAALTEGFTAFMAVSLGLVLAGLITTSQILFGGRQLGSLPPVGMEWARDVVTVLPVVATATLALWMQYLSRKTSMNRIIVLSGLALSVLVYSFYPWPLTLAAAAFVSSNKADVRNVRFSLESNPSTILNRHPIAKYVPDKHKLRLTFVANGLPDDTEVQTDGLTLELTTRGGRTWSTGRINVLGLEPFPNVAGETRFTSLAPIDWARLGQDFQTPLTVRGTAYLTVFGRQQTHQVSLQPGFATGPNGMRCSSDQVQNLFCICPFRWPERSISAKIGQNLKPLNRMVSYSPFPAEFGVVPMEFHYAGGLGELANGVTLVSREPVAHIRCDFESHDVRLIDYTLQ